MDGKICQNIKPPTSTHILFSVQLTTWGKDQKIRLQTIFIFLLYVNILKIFFVSETKFNRFRKMSIFSYSLLPQKTQKNSEDQV